MGAGRGAPLAACHCCGRIQHLPALRERGRFLCSRCGTPLRGRGGRRAARWTAALALSALILYPLAITLPILRLERFGITNEASLWSGTLSLLAEGEIAVGLIVLACSILIPIGKLSGLLVVCSRSSVLSRRRKALFYRAIEWAGRWGMVDVLLVAILVAVLKIGDLVEVEPGPGLLAFTACVVLSLVASATFDPHALWHEEPAA